MASINCVNDVSYRVSDFSRITKSPMILSQYQLALAEDKPVKQQRRGLALAPAKGVRMVMTGKQFAPPSRWFASSFMAAKNSVHMKYLGYIDAATKSSEDISNAPMIRNHAVVLFISNPQVRTHFYEWHKLIYCSTQPSHATAC